MLQLQRASAGSGKTYTLAKKYIWYLITVRRPDGSYRLRTQPEIADSLPRILAITFTNKATNEMKQRIIEKLADLSRAASVAQLSQEEIEKINYLQEFVKALGVPAEEIGRACEIALSYILNEYSGFKISTIDSFFQSVLRTFTYESNLSESYQVEINNDYLSVAAVDSVLNELDDRKGNGVAAYWLGILMRDESRKGSKNWNVFQRSGRRESIYSRLISLIKRLETEDFKKIRGELEDYFEKGTQENDNLSSPAGSKPGVSGIDDPLIRAWKTALKTVVTPAAKALARAKEQAAKLNGLFEINHLDISEVGIRYLDSHIRKISGMTLDSIENFSIPDMEKHGSVIKKTGKKKNPVVECPDEEEMFEVACGMYDAYSFFKSQEWNHWKAYSTQIPYVGLIGEIHRMMKTYLDEANSIQLGETGSILRRIIGDDDAPFIYERLGSRLDNFLIDEFQDTSRLQWDNLFPLIHESDSRGGDNLIIGDAKQSIYRFRNAEPSLITKEVPEAFPNRINAGMSKEENTNWRSDRTVVEFNNRLFHTLAEKMSLLSYGYIDFSDLYSNVVQYAAHQERKGYVEVDFVDSPETALSRVGPLISELISRGYRQNEIAILVHTNERAKEVIDYLVTYNLSLSTGAPKVEFISDESLLISSSEAVSIIISVLEKLTSGSLGKENGDDEVRRNFSFFSLRHPELSPAEQYALFKEEGSPVEEITGMLGRMQAVALPALIEAITERFVPSEMRRTQAVFIAGLQDLVLEYCEGNSADIISFLDWWRKKGIRVSITSPEGTDAIQIMTIHKSKGLEFKCVIIPFDDSSLVPDRKSEWKWVRPDSFFEGLGFPPFIPVVTTSSLENTIHSEVYREYFDHFTMDQLNSFYVAFTRAVSELYIFTGIHKKKGKTIGAFLNEVFTDYEGLSLLPENLVRWDDDHECLKIGEKPDVIRKSGDSGRDSDVANVITDYYVDSSPELLQFVEGDDDASTTLLPDAEDTDPRSEGNLLHGILSGVETKEDIAKAVLKYKISGRITSSQAKEWEKLLSDAVSLPETKDWFKKGWRVLNERDFIFPGEKNRRPDRVIIAPDRSHAIIIDYKFGEIPDDNRHIKQVNKYIMGFREISHIHDVRGFVWYVRKGKIFGCFATND